MQGAERESMNVFEKIKEKLKTARNCSDWIAVESVIQIIDQVAEEYNNVWIPVAERFPEDDKYILLSFSNFTIPMIGRYEEDEDGGAFYLGDEDETCVSQDLFVNAWMLLPEPYKKGE